MYNAAIKTIIVEDEPLASEAIIKSLNDIKVIDMIASFSNAEDAAQFLSNKDVHLIITDINLPNISGLDLVESLVNPPLIIVTTADPEYAINAFNLDIVDYLLKPISKPRLFKAINKVLRRFKIEDVKIEQEQDRLEYIFVKSEYKLIKINVEDILLSLIHI